MRKLLKNIVKIAFLSSALFLTTASAKLKAQQLEKIADIGDYSAPVFYDENNDGLVDIIAGEENGNLVLFRNQGTTTAPDFALETETYAGIDVGEYAAPFFCDIDGDGKAELFIGNRDGIILSYKNVGTAEPEWQLVENYFKDIDVGSRSKLAFYDTDSDGDLDAIVGEYQGNLNLYENTGTKTTPEFKLKNEIYADIDVGSRAAPFFCDFNGNGKTTLLIGRGDGKISLYEKAGAEDVWQKVTDNYNLIDAGETSTIALADINNDGSLDALIGAKNGDILFYNDFAKMLLYIERKYTNSIKLMFESRQGTTHKLWESPDLINWAETSSTTSTGYNELVLPVTQNTNFYRVSSE